MTAALAPNFLSAGNTFEVLMLNKIQMTQKKMVFSRLLKVAVGDTVSFIPKNKGHNSEIMKGMIPDGAEAWKGKLNKQVDVTFTVPGFYGYQCKPHANQGMSGLIVVEGDGMLDNLEAARGVKHRGKAKKAWKELWKAADEAGLTGQNFQISSPSKIEISFQLIEDKFSVEGNNQCKHFHKDKAPYSQSKGIYLKDNNDISEIHFKHYHLYQQTSVTKFLPGKGLGGARDM